MHIYQVEVNEENAKMKFSIMETDLPSFIDVVLENKKTLTITEYEE